MGGKTQADTKPPSFAEKKYRSDAVHEGPETGLK